MSFLSIFKEKPFFDLIKDWPDWVIFIINYCTIFAIAKVLFDQKCPVLFIIMYWISYRMALQYKYWNIFIRNNGHFHILWLMSVINMKMAIAVLHLSFMHSDSRCVFDNFFSEMVKLWLNGFPGSQMCNGVWRLEVSLIGHWA